MHAHGASEPATKPYEDSIPPDPELLIGTVIDGRYRLTEVLGSGGMATVFRAEHTTIRRPVALKLMRPSLGRLGDFAARFEREAYALGRLRHESCVQVIDFGRDGHVVYLVMDYVEGKSLASILDDEIRLDWRRALRLCRDVAAGLAAAHAEGIVHRDIKPQNIVVTNDGVTERAKVLDFGIAKLVDSGDDNRLTAVGTTVGTPTYIAPEQAIGGDVSGATDLYSLSVMLYEMIAGRAPFRSGEPMQVVFQHINAPVPYLSQEVNGLPEGLCRLVRQGLAKDPAHRPASAREYVARIDSLLQPPRLAPETVVQMQHAPAPARRSWLGLGALGAAAAAIAVFALTGWSSSSATAPQSTAKAVSTSHTTSPAPRQTTPAPVTTPVPAPATPSETNDEPEPEPEPEPMLDYTATAEAAQRKLVAGHRYMAKNWWTEGFRNYRAAIELDPSLRSDPKLIRQALRSLQSRRHPGAGIRFIRDVIGEPAVPYLKAATKNRHSLRLSRRARQLLKQMGR